MKYKFLLIGSALALGFWLWDSSLHYLVYKEPIFEVIPTDLDELWMRLAICFLLVLFGWYADFSKTTREHESQESEDKFRSLFEQTGDYILVLEPRPDGLPVIVDANQAAIDQHGFSREEFIGKSIDELDRNAQLKSRVERTQRALSGEHVVFETTHTRKDGSIFHVEASVKLLQIADDTPLLVSVERDITERRRVIKALLQSEQQFKAMFEKAPLGIAVTDSLTGLFQDVNPRFAEIAGRTREQLVTTDWMNITHPDDLQNDLSEIEHLNTGKISGFSMQKRLMHPDGSVVWINLTLAPFISEEKEHPCHLRMIEDITDRKQAETALRESEAKYSRLVETAQDLIWQCDMEGRFIYLNSAWQKTHGYKISEMLGRPFTDFEPPEVAEHEFEVFQSHLDGGESLGHETIHLSKSGEVIHLIFNAVATRDEQGNIVGTHGTAIDITARKKMEEELLKVEKLESIGVLAGGIAHDLNNYLTGIVGNIGLAKMYTDPVEKDRRLVIAEADALRIKDLTMRLLTFSKGGSPITQCRDLGEVVRDAVNFTLSGTDIACDFDLRDESYPAEIDTGQVKQVIHNFVINAQQAMGGGGKITVSVEDVELGEENNIPLTNGPYVKVAITDTGVGIPEEIHQRIFDPFFSTKATGSGLGLATSYSIIQKHGGYITFESEVGVGTKFEAYLPACKEESIDREDTPESDSLSNEGRILVMDDQESIRNIIEIFLSKVGYNVVTCVDGIEAVENYKAAMGSGNPFSAVILDLTIPGGMGGRVTIRKLTEVDPGVIAVVASGYADDPVMTNYLDHGFKAAITKPYKIEDLTEVLHQVIPQQRSLL